MNEDTIIGDDNYQDYMEAPTGFSKGMMERTAPFGSLPFAAASTMPKIPRSEWSDRIKRMESEQSRLSDLVRGVGMKSLDQNGTNFCWANGPVNCVRIIRCVNNLPFVDLSPASVACPINGFVNQGGWGTEALKYIVEHGIVPVSLWPPNAIDRQYDNAESKESREKFKVTEWDDLPPRDFDLLMTYLFNRIPVAIGLNWWRHEVTALDPVETSPGVFGVRIWNSWSDDWPSAGAGGMSVLTQSKATPDDAVAPRVVVASS